MKEKTLLALMLTASCFVSGNAQAQVVDYAGLEEIFGEPVTTSATGKPQRVSEVPVSMEIISQRDIRESGALDIPALLRRVAGVEVTRSFIGQADVNIRGYNQSFSNRLLVLVNGRQVYQDQYGMTIWQAIPVQMNEIRQIEVIRGPNSSLYGFNAASGVVNIVTDRALVDDNSTYQMRVGTQNYRELSGIETLNFSEDFAVRMSGNVRKADGYDRDNSFGPSVRDDDAIDVYNFALDSEYQISEKTHLRFETGINHSELDQDIPYNIATKTKSLTRHYGATLTHDSKDFGVWTLRGYRNESSFSTLLDSLGETTIHPIENQLHVLQLSDLISLNEDHTLRVGVEYRENEMEGLQVGSAPSRYEMETMAANAMWNWNLNDQWSWTNAARVDHWEAGRTAGSQVTFETILPTLPDSREETEFTFNSGLLYKPNDRSSYRFSVGRGIRIPSLVELGQNAISATGIVEIYGNPMLEPESNLTFEVGYNRVLQTGETPMEFFSNIYTQELNDVVVPVIYGFGTGAGALPDATYLNAGDSRAFGLEVGVTGKAFDKRLRWGVNYAYVTIDDDVNAGPQGFMEYEQNQPHHKLNASAHYREDKWNFGLDASYVSGREMGWYHTIDFVNNGAVTAEQESYLLLNSTIGYQLHDNVWVSLDGYNLVDEHNERPSVYLPIGNDNIGGNRLGRTLLLTVTSRF